MFGNKRLAKRSIVGTRIGAMWPQDGRYYPGIILAQVSEETITSNAVYYIKFDDGFMEQIKSRFIVGPGFQSVTSAVLKRGQRVYLTWNGREVGGTVIRHDRDTDEVTAIVRTPTGEEFETVVKLEDIRLLESRKSARLVDQQDTDYSKLADLQLESNRRKITSSHVIDVPSTTYNDKSDNYRRYRPSPEESHDGDTSGNFDDVEMMDEMIAATVLTSLSVSPTSPKMMSRFPNATTTNGKDMLHDGHFPYPDSHLSSSVASSGFYSGHSERDDSSPPLPPLSESAPATIIDFKPPTPGSEDDSSEGSSGHGYRQGSSIIYQCTWRGCHEKALTSDAIERHIRRAHFDRDSDIELTDNEEEFHYTEVDVTANSINTMTKSFAAMNTSSSSVDEIRHKNRHRHLSSDNGSYSNSRSALGTSGSFGVSDHDYNRKMSKQPLASSMPINGQNFPQQPPSSIPISISEGQIKRTLSWHSQSSPQSSSNFQPVRTPKLTPQERLYQHQAQSPKSNVAPPMLKVTQHRRPRSEVRKCRKVYGMDHREQWCTQCKWKKACTRFVD